MAKNEGGRPLKLDDKLISLGTSFRVKRKHIDRYGIKYWRKVVHEFLNKKQGEIENA